MKKIVSFFLCAIFLFSGAEFLNTGKAAVPEKEQRVKMLFDSNFAVYKERDDEGGARISSWDINDAGGRLLDAAYLQMADQSDLFPIEAVRHFESVRQGKAQLQFAFYCSGCMEGGGFQLRSGSEKILSLAMHGGVLSVNNIVLTTIGADTDYTVRIRLDFDAQLADVYINETLAAGGVAFSLPQAGADNFYISSGAAAVGQLAVRYARMHTGYAVYEDFDCGGKLPPDWRIHQGETILGKTSTNEISSVDGDTRIETEFEPLSGPVVVEFDILQKEKRNVEFRLQGDGQPVATIGTDGENFLFGDALLYQDYLENMWYSVKLMVDPQKNTADVYLNGKCKAKDAPLESINAETVSGAAFYAEKSAAAPFIIDSVRIYPYETFEDYVPQPQKITSSNYTIGMQQCPLWHEGVLWGNDWINDSQIRRPVLGFYDENSPEAMDWSIKFMAEHGVDFQWICLNLYGEIDQPREPQRMTGMIHDAYFYARYSDMVKFAVLWENAAVHNWTQDTAYNREMFLTYTVPFWIEYYFKDSRYQTVGGRPLLGIYNYANLRSAFGTPQEIAAVIEAMGDLCQEAGVGRPYVVLSAYLVDFSSGTFELYKSSGMDASYAYNMGEHWGDEQLAYHSRGVDAAAAVGEYEYIPTITMGFDSYVWGGNPGVKLTPEDFETYLHTLDQEIMPRLGEIEGEKPIIMAGTWNEFSEGHYFMPTQKDGFAYLEGIRKYLAGNSQSHEDLLPSTAQLERINNMYPADRKTPLKEKDIPEQIPQQAQVKAQWNFASAAGGWKAVDGSCNIENIGGALRVTPIGEEAVFELDAIGVDISSSPYIRFKLKSNASTKVTMWYTTDSATQISQKRKINRYIKEKTEIALPVGIYVRQWQGMLGTLRFAFNGEVEIETIEILSVPEEDGYLLLENRRYERMKDFSADRIPLSEITRLTGDSLYAYDGVAVYKRRDGADIVSLSEGECSINGVKVGTLSGWHVEGGELYADERVATLITGKTVRKNGNNISVSSDARYAAALLREEFDQDFGYFTQSNGINQKQVEGGYLKVAFQNDDPFINTAGLEERRIKCKEIESVRITLKSQQDFQGQLFYATSENGVYNEAMSVKFDVFAGEQEYIVRIANQKLSGTLTGLRLDLGRGENSVAIDDIRVLKKIPVASYISASTPANGALDAAPTDRVTLSLSKAPEAIGEVTIAGGNAMVTEAQLSGSVITAYIEGMEQGTKYKLCFHGIDYGTVTSTEYLEFTTKISPGEVYGYEFDASSVHWGGNYKTFSTAEGIWTILARAGARPYFYMKAFRAETEEINYIDIQVKSEQPITGKIYFQTDAAPGMDENKTFSYNISGSDWDYLSIPVSGHSLWSGIVTQIRLDFGAAAMDNRILVDYVRFRGEHSQTDPWICGGHFTSGFGSGEIFMADAVYNNTDAARTAVLIAANYESGRLIGVRKNSISIQPHTAESIGIFRPAGAKLFLWDEQSLAPICDKAKVEK